MKYTSLKERNYCSKINIEEFINSNYGIMDDKFYYELKYHQLINEIEYVWADKEIIQNTLSTKMRITNKTGYSENSNEEIILKSIKQRFNQPLLTINEEVTTRQKESSMLLSVIFYKDKMNCSLFEAIESVNKIIHEEITTPNH